MREVAVHVVDPAVGLQGLQNHVFLGHVCPRRTCLCMRVAVVAQDEPSRWSSGLTKRQLLPVDVAGTEVEARGRP